MRKFSLSLVSVVCAAALANGCDQDSPTGPESSDTSVASEQSQAMRWYETDEDQWWVEEQRYLDCLGEWVTIAGDIIWFLYENDNKDYPDDVKETRWWNPSNTTMVGPSGTWTIVANLGPRPGQNHNQVDHTIWENEATQVRMHTRGAMYSAFPACWLVGNPNG